MVFSVKSLHHGTSLKKWCPVFVAKTIQMLLRFPVPSDRLFQAPNDLSFDLL